MGPDGFTCKEVGPDDPIDGIKARDWASYVGPSSIYYMMQFFRMQETRRKAVISFLRPFSLGLSISSTAKCGSRVFFLRCWILL